MYIDNVVLDINKSPEENIIEKVNAVNGLRLNFNDFVFAEPEAHSGAPFPQANTKVLIVPKATSQYYNSFTVFYKRMDIESILNNEQVSVTRTTEENLSELIDQINLKYNVNITADDYYDSPLSAVDPLDPDAEVPVMFTCNVNSLLFKGSYLLVLNKRVVEAPIVTMDAADVFILLDQPNEPINKSALICRTSLGDPVSNFVFFRNANTSNMIHIDKMTYLKDRGFVLFGQFEFNADLDGNGARDHNTNCILMSNTGKILENLDSLFESTVINDCTIVENSHKSNLYLIDRHDSIAMEPSMFYKYLSNGSMDMNFQLENVTEPVIYARVDKDEKIYIVTQFTDTNNQKQYWIDRHLSDGSKDNTFTKAVLTISGADDPWPIARIEPIEGDFDTTTTGVYVALAMQEQPESLGRSPLVNDIPLVDGGQTESFGFLPIFKLLNSGIKDNNFVSVQREYIPTAVYEFEPGVTENIDKYITATGNGVTMLSRRVNPITGNMQYLPMSYDHTGKLQKASGEAYFNSYYWTEAPAIYSLYRNSTIVYGECRLPDTNGGYMQPLSTVASYDSKSSNQALIYQVPFSGSDTPTIKDIIVFEAV